MDKRKAYYIVIDTETANGILENDKLDLSQSLVYDCGWAVIDKQGNIYEKRSFVVADIFLDYREMMKSAYYADKLPRYWKEIKSGKRTLTSLYKVHKQFIEDVETYNIKAIVAHNASFDLRALNNTYRYITKSKNRYFFPYGVEIWDTLKMSRQTIAKTKGYQEFCQTNNYMTAHKKPQVRLTAEILWKYLSGDYDFEESHTGLEDVEIELEIFVHCLKTHKKIEKCLYKKKERSE